MAVDISQYLSPNWKPPPLTPLDDTVGGAWVNPDWQQALLGDPGVIAANAALSGGTTSAGLNRKNAIAQALIKWGIQPNLDKIQNADIRSATQEALDPTTMAAIGDPTTNPQSELARIEGLRSRGTADLMASLGARGMLQGGATTGGLQMQQNAYDQNYSDATNNLLAALSGDQGDYLSTVGGLQNSWNTALGEGANRVQAAYKPYWVPGTPKATDPGITAPPVVAPPVGVAPGGGPDTDPNTFITGPAAGPTSIGAQAMPLTPAAKVPASVGTLLKTNPTYKKLMQMYPAYKPTAKTVAKSKVPGSIGY